MSVNEDSKVSIPKLVKVGDFWQWQPIHIEFLKEHYNEYTNQDFAEIFGCPKSTIAQRLGKMFLYRSQETISRIRSNAAHSLWIKLSEEPERKAEYLADKSKKISKSCKARKKSELFRTQRLYLPQRTKWILEDHQSERAARHYLKKFLNYMVERNGKEFYYDDLTQRSAQEDYYIKRFNFKFIEAE